MKRILIAVLFCFLILGAAYGQEVELPSFDDNTPTADAKPSKQRRFGNEIAVSIFANGLSLGSRSPFERYTYTYSGTPYTDYTESLYVVGQDVINYSVGVQYLRSCSWEYFSYGVIAGLSNRSQDLCKRTTGKMVNRYDRTDLFVAPVLKCNFIEGRFLRVYCYVGAALNTAFETLDGNSSIESLFNTLYCVGWSLGREVFLFNEVGWYSETAFSNLGLGIRF